MIVHPRCADQYFLLRPLFYFLLLFSRSALRTTRHGRRSLVTRATLIVRSKQRHVNAPRCTGALFNEVLTRRSGGCNSRGVSRRAVTIRAHPREDTPRQVGGRGNTRTLSPRFFLPRRSWYAFDDETYPAVLLITSALCSPTGRRGVAAIAASESSSLRQKTSPLTRKNCNFYLPRFL